MMARAQSRQQGATLLVSLIMLVVLTLFAISMINNSSIGLRIVSNFQAQKAMEQGANEVMENYISLSSNFDTGTTAQAAVCVNGADGSCTGGYHVIMDAPTCLYSAPASGYSKKVGELSPDDVDWEVVARIVDPADNTKQYMRIVEGVRVRMLAGACP